jgi:hypothetical protein
MTLRQPPRLASLLMKLLVDNDPLAGDLQEQYRAGRSAAWFWRQAGSAVFGEVRRFNLYELFAARGRFMQCVMVALISVCVVFSVKLIAVVVVDEEMLRRVIGHYGLPELLRIVLSLAVALPTGVAVARLREHSRAATVLVLSAMLPAWAFANVYLLDASGSFDAVLPNAVALLVFIVGLLAGGIQLQRFVDRALAHRRGV